MSLIAQDAFIGGSLSPWWLEQNAGLITEPPVVSSGYCRLRCAVGGGGGSFHFNDDDGYLLYQLAIGDFDVVADIEALSYDELGVPPATGNARLLTLSVHSPVKPEASPQYVTSIRTYYHRGIGRAPGASVPGDPLVVEWKYTRENGGPPPVSLSIWDTINAPNPASARCWIRIRRQGTLVTSWHAPESPEIPGDSDWVDMHQINFPELPDLVQIGPTIYSSVAGADITGRFHSIYNYGV